MKNQDLITGLFRSEFRKITAVLCHHFGIEYIEVAEDIASETFLTALETWPYRGIPENPTAWLYLVAKNKAKNQYYRHRLFKEKIIRDLSPGLTPVKLEEIDLSDSNIKDSELKMLFAICHKAIPLGSQVGLALRILCGFGISEIATALLTNPESINKRLYRAREKLREEKVIIAFPDNHEIDDRLDAVLTTLYLLFNEGYYSESHSDILREELCLEAMRLTYLLIGNGQTNLPKVNALFALMCFHSSRFGARKNQAGELILYEEQDELKWNQELIAKGAYHLSKASQGSSLSKYHLEAGIAYWHTIKTDTTEKWENILQLYNRLLRLAYSPIVALNRTFVLAKTNGVKKAILEAEKLKLDGNRFYHLLLGELYSSQDREISLHHFETAKTLTKRPAEKQKIEIRMCKV